MHGLSSALINYLEVSDRHRVEEAWPSRPLGSVLLVAEQEAG